MSNLSDSQKLYGEILRGELEAYRKLETWGASLFLGAIGLVAKQLAEWDQIKDTAKQVVLHPWAFTIPAFVGLVALVFLRVVNFRGRAVSERLFALAKPGEGRAGRSFGWLGWLLAAMPLTLGFAVSWYFAIDRPSRRELMLPISATGAIILALAFALHYLRWQRIRKG
jgi:hypothetical protein